MKNQTIRRVKDGRTILNNRINKSSQEKIMYKNWRFQTRSMQSAYLYIMKVTVREDYIKGKVKEELGT